MGVTVKEFTTKDSGERLQFASGMVRDVTTGKTNYLLPFSGPMFDRWAALLTRGAEKYTADNWMKAQGEAELQRFKESAARHFVQWLRGDTDEDHAAAVFFNLNGAEYVKDRIESAKPAEPKSIEQPAAEPKPARDTVADEYGALRGCNCDGCEGIRRRVREQRQAATNVGVAGAGQVRLARDTVEPSNRE
jgi:hypothetical protein